MVIFLYGTDTHRLKQNVKLVADNYRKKHQSGLNYFQFNLSQPDDYSKLEDTIKSSSFFSEIKLVGVKNIFASAGMPEKIIDLIKQFNINADKELVLLVCENQDRKDLLSKNKKLFGLLSEGSLVKEFNLLEGIKLENWVKREITARNCSVSTATARKLIGMVGNDSWALINEIEKLCNYKRKGDIKDEDLALLVPERIDLNIFDFIDAIGDRNKARAYELLYKEIKNGRDPYYILTMVIYQFRNLLTIKDLMLRDMASSLIAKNSGLHPFVVRKSLNSAGKFNMDDLKKTYGHLLNFDTSAKMGRIDLTDTLFKFVLAG